ncbi:MAG: AraC family transcriptional regulator ligand-binding domain-containing protein [Gammaproteobacteria bacterium]
MRDTGPDRDIPLVPVDYTVALARFMGRQGVGIPTLLAGTDIPEDMLHDPGARLSIAQAARVIARATALKPTPGLGFEYGLELDLNTHGLLGWSVLRRTSMRELARDIVDHLRVRLPLMDMRMETSDVDMWIRIEDSVPLGAARQFVAEAYLGSIYALASAGFRQIAEISCDFPQPRPAAFQHRIRCPVSFGRQHNQILIRLHSEDTKAVDLRNHPLYVDQYARSLLARELPRDGGVSQRVRHCIMSDPGRHKTLESVAEDLGLSVRSLRRHLQADGASFSDIRNAMRKQLAICYLRGSDLLLESIATRLGYGDQATFSRAFREWTGLSPGRFRRGQNPGTQPPAP